ncbi:aminotransferase class V-fold PLP-dependent enzyme, partial [Candidatus Aerophobetes bacterium]|nr:aminotransferase class V-fold PLP-dependent enzyme [Candidatus Aerophobetes bacterium]
MHQRKVYLDNNATTRVDEEVLRYMNNFHLIDYAVASSQFSHTPGIKAKEAVEEARKAVAKSIGAKEDEVIFTSGATESNNLALKGVAFANLSSRRRKIVISTVEHFSVLHSAEKLKRFGFEVEYARVDKEGFVDIEHLTSLVDDKTLLVSIIFANHEVGTIQKIKPV